MLNADRAQEVDFVRELQLRRWARENYVPAQQRRSTWHPVIVEEMCAKDAELDEQSRNRAIASAYVPLAPTTFHTYHAPHADRTDPNLLRETQRFEVFTHG